MINYSPKYKRMAIFLKDKNIKINENCFRFEILVTDSLNGKIEKVRAVWNSLQGK